MPGYTTERREAFYESEDFDTLKKLIPEVLSITSLQGNVVDGIGKERANECVLMMARVIDITWKMVIDARADLEAEREMRYVQSH